MPVNYIKLLDEHKTVAKAAKAANLKKSTFFDRLNKQRTVLDYIQNISAPAVSNPKNNRAIKRYIFTCAVAGAQIHTDFFDNLKAYAEHLGAELAVGTLKYPNQTNVGAPTDEENDIDNALADFITDTPIVVGDRVRYSPELHLRATMVNPLQGLETYSKRYWSIFPHTKVSLESVPTHKDRPTKMVMTTGAVTLPSYSPTKAGFRAHFDHVCAAVICEVTTKGAWCRHVTPANEFDGTFYDLDKIISEGSVYNHNGVEAVIYGDIHVEQLDWQVGEATWGMGNVKPAIKQGCLANVLKPKHQIFHDLMDMTAINHHEIGDFFARMQRYMEEGSYLQGDCEHACNFLQQVVPFAENNIVVNSNHDDFVKKWLLKFDPNRSGNFVSAEEFYRLRLRLMKAIEKMKPFSILEETLRELGNDDVILDHVGWLTQDESFMIMNVECGWHGHYGPNGRRGSARAFKFVTEKSTVAHSHVARIESGCHQVGTASKIDLTYNKGPSSWSHTHGIIYPHGGRSLLTMSDGKFFAAQY